MEKPLTGVRANEILGRIRNNLREADKVFWNVDSDNSGADDNENIAYFLESAFIQTLVFLEAVGLTEMFRIVRTMGEEARKDYSATVFSHEIGEPFLVWSLKLGQYLDALETMFGESLSGRVTKDVVEIVRATQYAITDRACFPNLPESEADVHARIEAVLQCVFPDLIHKPAIPKQLKHFEPDTGLPEQKTLIEYKFVSSKSDAKLISDQILADVGGYVSDEWKYSLYVVYETQRVYPERQWIEHLRKCGVGENTSIVVLCGEQPKKPKTISSDKKVATP
jgi:DpnII restriction endonuclease